jgi:hypothetical protein
MFLIHLIYQLADLIAFFQRERVAPAIACYNIQPLCKEQSFIIKYYFKNIFKKDFQVKNVAFLGEWFKIDSLIGDYKLPLTVLLSRT